MKEMLTRPGTFPILLDEPAMVGIPCISVLIDLLNNPVFTNLRMKECLNRKYSEPQTKPLSLPLPVFQTPFLCLGLHKAILVIPCVFNSLWFFCGPWQGIKCETYTKYESTFQPLRKYARDAPGVRRGVRLRSGRWIPNQMIISRSSCRYLLCFPSKVPNPF